MTASQILSVQTKCHRDLDVASASRRSELVLGWLWRLKPRRGQPLVNMSGGFQLAYLFEQPILLGTRT